MSGQHKSEEAFHATRAFTKAPLHKLTRRADYQRAKAGKRAHVAPFIVQARARGDDEPPRIGITVTRKVGGAVVRNRIKRRLKHAIGRIEGLGFRPGYDYVLIARALSFSVPFERLTGALDMALRKVHQEKGHQTDPQARPTTRKNPQ